MSTPRPAELADLAALGRLESECFPTDAWPAAYLRSGIAGEMPAIRILVAEEDGVVAGYAIVSVVFEIAELQRVGVTASHRRHGLARRLVRAAVDLARTDGADRLLLEVRSDNAPALTLYLAAGFTQIDRRERYYRDGAAALVLSCPLT